MYKTKVCEALEINRLEIFNEKDDTVKVLNRDNGGYFTTNSWKAIFRKIRNPLNSHFDVNLSINLKVAFSNTSRTIIAF